MNVKLMNKKVYEQKTQNLANFCILLILNHVCEW